MIPQDVLDRAHAECETRLGDVESPLLTAARAMEETPRRRAFLAVYLSLRTRAAACLPRPRGRARSTEQAIHDVRAWRDAARLCHQGDPDHNDPVAPALADAMLRFSIPMTPWLRMEEGLLDVIRREPIPDMPAFMERGRRLAQAPSAALFRILCAQLGWRRYRVYAEIDIEELAHDPAMFAYIVGVMCDSFSEVAHTHPPETSLPGDLMRRHSITVERLLEIRRFLQSPRDFEDLMWDMAHIAWKFYDSGVAKLAQAAAHLPSDALLILDGFLARYRNTLREMERRRFVPPVFDELAPGLEPRVAHLRRNERNGAEGVIP